ncbi:MAG: ankyrin repeat domain-containing protein, partial [Phycisphaerae bacterium]
MTAKYKTCSALKVVLLFISLSGLFPANLSGDEGNKYLEAVKEFADNVLKYGRDTYGPKHTPLFVDGLNIHTHEPVKWIDPDGTRWILSNFANQQTLLRTLDGLSSITGDAKYQQAAMDAIRYMFDHVRTPNGLLYWGGRSAYDASADQVRAWDQHHTFKLNYPYYELMWKVDSKETKRFIEAYWSAHVNDWSNLDFNRYARLNSVLEEPWNHEYKGGPTFFKSKFGSHGFSNTATSMIQAGTTLYRLSRQEQPLVWSKRLAKRFIDTRHPKTGMSLPYYNNPIPPLGDDLKEHFQNPRTVYFPGQLFEERRRISIRPANSAVLIWLSLILVGDTLGEHGKEFKQWALEELTAWGNVSYRKKDNSFVPILTDGTNIEGYVSKRFTPHSPKGGGIAKTLFADLGFFWGYAVAYRVTSDEFMWEMVRNIAFGNDLGDIGETSIDAPKLRTDTTCSDVYGLLGLLELYAKTNKSEFLKVAQSIGDNIVGNQFYKGFFVPSKRHIYTRFDCFEPLALLHLQAATTSKTGSVPQVWPCYPVFTNPYRHKEIGVDRRTIYTLTESSEPPLSLQEAAAIGDIELVCSLLDKGVGVNSWESPMADTALHRAARSGHKDIVKLLLEKGALVDSLDSWPGATPLHYAAEKGHKEIAELLIANGADVNVKDKRGRTPIYYAAENGHKEIVELLIAKGADVNAKNNAGQTPLDVAKSKDIVELLRTKGADAS